MTQADKELLLKDLCARLPYGVMVSVQGGEFDSYKYPYQLTAVSKFGLDSFCKVYHPIFTPFGGAPNVEDIKPFLRPMSSMTEEEKNEYLNTFKKSIIGTDEEDGRVWTVSSIDWLNAHHFDYRALIDRGLAIAVTKDNNPYEEFNSQTRRIYQ